MEEALAETVFERYWEENNPSLNAINYDYLISEDEGNYYVDEIGELQGRTSVRRTLIYDPEDEFVIIEAPLNDDLAKLQKERYENLGSYSNFSE